MDFTLTRITKRDLKPFIEAGFSEEEGERLLRMYGKEFTALVILETAARVKSRGDSIVGINRIIDDLRITQKNGGE